MDFLKYQNLRTATRASFGLEAVLTYGFLIGLATYPLEEYRLELASVALPYAIPFLLVMAMCQLPKFGRFDAFSRPAVLSIALFGVLVLATLVGQAFYSLDYNADRFKGLFYFLTPVVLSDALRRRRAQSVILVLIAACTVPVLVGWIRYVSVTGGIPSEHAIGYWGIRYMPATRNSDVLYPIAVFTLSLYALFRYRRVPKLLSVALLVVSGSAVALSLSRGAWFAVAGACIVVLGTGSRRVRALSLIAAAAAVVIALILTPDTFVELIVDRASTLASVDDSTVSNLDRLALIVDSLLAIVTHPLGVGFGNMGWVVSRQDMQLWNSENGWLTVGVEGGWLALWIFGYLTCVQLARASRGSRSIGAALTVTLFIYLIFNYELNSAFMWALLTVAWTYTQPAARPLPTCVERAPGAYLPSDTWRSVRR